MGDPLQKINLKIAESSESILSLLSVYSKLHEHYKSIQPTRQEEIERDRLIQDYIKGGYTIEELWDSHEVDKNEAKRWIKQYNDKQRRYKPKIPPVLKVLDIPIGPAINRDITVQRIDQGLRDGTMDTGTFAIQSCTKREKILESYIENPLFTTEYLKNLDDMIDFMKDSRNSDLIHDAKEVFQEVSMDTKQYIAEEIRSIEGSQASVKFKHGQGTERIHIERLPEPLVAKFRKLNK